MCIVSLSVFSASLRDVVERTCRRYVPRVGNNQAIGVIAHGLCGLIWNVLHQGNPVRRTRTHARPRADNKPQSGL